MWPLISRNILKICVWIKLKLRKENQLDPVGSAVVLSFDGQKNFAIPKLKCQDDEDNMLKEFTAPP